MLKNIFVFTCLVYSMSSNAAPITYSYSAVVAGIHDDWNMLFGLGISAGSSTITGTFTYDPSTAPSHSLPAYNVSYYTTNEITAELDGTYNYSALSSNSAVYNDNSAFNDTFSSLADSFTQFDTPMGDRTRNIQIFMWDTTGGVFTDESLPTSLTLSDFDRPTVSIRAFNLDDSYYILSGEITALTVVSEVPLPAAAWLFGSALVGLAGIKRRKTAAQVIG